jgi:hypothetical protein
MDTENDAAIANGCTAYVTLGEGKAGSAAGAAPGGPHAWSPPARPPGSATAACSDTRTPQLAPGPRPFLQRGSGTRRRQEAWRSEQRYVPPGGFLLAPELDAGQAPFGAGAGASDRRARSAPAGAAGQPRRRAAAPAGASGGAAAASRAPAPPRRRSAGAGPPSQGAPPAAEPPVMQPPAGETLAAALAGSSWDDRERAWGAHDADLVGDGAPGPADADLDLAGPRTPAVQYAAAAMDGRGAGAPLQADPRGGRAAVPEEAGAGAEWADKHAWEEGALDERAADGAWAPGGGDGHAAGADAGLPLDDTWDTRDVEEVRTRWVAPVKAVCGTQAARACLPSHRRETPGAAAVGAYTQAYHPETSACLLSGVLGG